MAVPLHAQTTITWDAEGNGSTWTDPLNWSGDEVPDTVGENAVIDSILGVGSTVLLNGSSIDIGSLTINEDNTLNVRFDSGTLNLTGGLSNSGTLSHASSPSGNSRTVNLNVSGTNQIFNTSTGSIVVGSNSGRNRINSIMTIDAQNQNDGAISLSQTSSVDRDTIRFRLENSGTFTNNGTIFIQDTQSSTSSYSQLQLLTDGAAVTFGGTGSVTLDVGTLTDSARARIIGNGSGTLTNGINHTIQGAGLVGSNIDFINDGLVHATGDTATLDVNPDTAVTNSATGRFIASGIAGMSIGGGTDDFINNGHLEARTGSLIAINTSNATLNGVIAGAGQYSTGLALSSTSTLSPGDFLNGDGTGGSTVGILNVNLNLTLEDTTLLEFQLGADDVAGTDYDALAIIGSFILDGILNITELDGFGAGTYRIATFNSGELTDNGLSIGTAPSGYDYTFDANDLGGYVDLTVAAVPEPSTYALILGVGVVLLVANRKRRS
ncbi:PEP-CTERM sorting domain-containing protein [Cerasicoccus arenae]|uniref:Ice-binding protein C-terminal domain-containing protein n=2 Tax=Cerasicoccus arenae TaxID=424488 RepID=A0A8J3DE38_9BACT|nr:PEP-CTERM sorting domain-containing protein [Cerasicoccus arenae]MBK1856926.1 PEP-CTERM sorting domain-containing protein [Cerasicoccus arenae]GHB89883.1 hypothetical protein GCM10007047_00510 [Cerasicoccus arenae]